MERVGVVDRLGDLGVVAGHAGQVEVEMGDMTTATASEVDEALAPFAVVIGGIDKISKSVDLIGLLRRRSMQEVEEAGQRRLMDELDRVMVASKRNARLVRAELDRVAADNARLPPGSTIALIRRNLLNTQARHFREAIAEFQHAADSFRDALKQRVTRQARIIMEDVTDDQVEQMVESGQIYETMARLHDRTVDAVVEIEERHKGILAIEQGVRELQDLFGEMAYLVDLQGETLDVIERNVRDAKSYVAKAEKNLIKTEKHARNARGRQCCILLIVVLVCSVIVAVLTFPDIFGTSSRSRGDKHARLAAPAAAAADGVLSATLPAGHRWVVK